MIDYYLQDVTLYALTSLLVWKLIQLTSLHWLVSLIIAFPIAIVIIGFIHVIETMSINIATNDEESHQTRIYAQPNIFMKVIGFIQIFLILPFVLILYQVTALVQYWLDWALLVSVLIGIPITLGLLVIPALFQHLFHQITGKTPPLIMYIVYERFSPNRKSIPHDEKPST